MLKVAEVVAQDAGMNSKIARRNSLRKAYARHLRVAVLLLCVFAPNVLLANTTTLSGVIFTLDADNVQSLWPNAQVTLHNLSTGNKLATVSNDLGEYKFIGLL